MEQIKKTLESTPTYPTVPSHSHSVNVDGNNNTVINKIDNVFKMTTEVTKEALDVTNKALDELKQLKVNQILSLSKYERDYYKTDEIIQEVTNAASKNKPFNVEKKYIKTKTIEELLNKGFTVEEPEPATCDCIGNTFKGIETINISFTGKLV